MPDISILQPTVLRGVVEKFKAPEKLTLLGMVPQVSHPFPSVQWEVLQGARTIADLNVPNSEANIVPQRGRAQQSATFAYLREKKNFSPTTVLWMRKVAESAGDLSILQNAEQHIAREIEDLSQRADNRAEWMLWQALTGNLAYDDPETGVVIDVDYKYQSSHKPSPGTGWDTATATSIVDDIRAWKTLVRRDGMVEPTDAFVSEKTMTYITNAFVASGSSAGAQGQNLGALLTDRMREQFMGAGSIISGFMGLNWRIQESTYDAAGDAYTSTELIYPSAQTSFFNEDSLVLGNFSAGRPIELFVGPTADFEAPRNYTGKFVKTWEEKDPSGRQALLEWALMPVITRPEQMIYVSDVTA